MKTTNILSPGQKLRLMVEGMHCAACELVVEKKFRDSKLVSTVNATLKDSSVSFEVKRKTDKDMLLQELNSLIAPDGYSLKETLTTKPVNYKQLATAFLIAIVLMGGFLLLQELGIANVIGSETLSLPVVFLIGIIASLSTCMAVVGGLVLSISSSYAKGRDKVRPLALFHIARLVAFFVLGGLIGWLGSLFELTPGFYFVSSILLFLVMLVLGLNLLDVFPFMQRLQLRLPKSLTAGIISNEKVQNSFTPVILGIATFFLPCGFTQSMQFAAVTGGDIMSGALTMLVFALGTLPVLALLSFSSVKLSQSRHGGLFFKTAGFLVLLFAISNFQAALVAAGLISPIY